MRLCKFLTTLVLLCKIPCQQLSSTKHITRDNINLYKTLLSALLLSSEITGKTTYFDRPAVCCLVIWWRPLPIPNILSVITNFLFILPCFSQTAFTCFSVHPCHHCTTTLYLSFVFIVFSLHKYIKCCYNLEITFY